MNITNYSKNEATLKNMLLFFLCLLLSLSFSACEKNAEVEYEITPTSLKFNAAGGEKEFKVYVRTPASVESITASDSWCQVYTSGESPVCAIVKVNPSTDGARTTSITVNMKSGKNKISASVQISQTTATGDEGDEGDEGNDGEKKEYSLTYLDDNYRSHKGVYGRSDCIPGTTYYMSACINFTAAQMNPFVGGELRAINVEIPAAQFVKNIIGSKVWIKNSLTGAIVYEQTFSPQFDRFNKITLNTPQIIKSGAFVIGYTLTITAETDRLYPFCYSDEAINPYQQGGFNTLLWTTNANAHVIGTDWYQPTTSGNLGIVGIVYGNFKTKSLSQGISSNFRQLSIECK